MERHLTDEISITTLVDLDQLQRLQDQFSEATDLAIIAVDYRGTPVTEAHGFTPFCQLMRMDPARRKLCYSCDAHGGLQAAIEGRPHIYRCHAGLVDFSVPITVGNQYVGAILCGQVQLGDLFIAYPGDLADGRRYIGDAITRGAVRSDREDAPSESHPSVSARFTAATR